MLVIGPSRSDRPKTDIPLVSVEKAVAGMLASEDYEEGCRAFTEKRSPKFTRK
jgi:uncharacterized pyridoxal phosphate-containing UPF0001 family protein